MEQVKDLGLVINDFTDSNNVNHKKGSIKMYKSDESDNSISIRQAFIDTLKQNKAIKDDLTIVKVHLAKLCEKMSYIALEVFYIELNTDLTNDEVIKIGFYSDRKSNIPDIIQAFIKTEDPTLMYSVRVAVCRGFAVNRQSAMSKLREMGEIKRG